MSHRSGVNRISSYPLHITMLLGILTAEFTVESYQGILANKKPLDKGSSYFLFRRVLGKVYPQNCALLFLEFRSEIKTSEIHAALGAKGKW